MNVPALRFKEFGDEWNVQTIEDLFTFKNGLNKEKEYFGKGTPIINFKDVYNGGGLKVNNIKGLVEVNTKEALNFSCKKGDVFFTRTSETIDDIGMSATLLDDIPNCVFSGFVLRARPKNDKLVDIFKVYCFSIETIRNEITSKSSYTTRALTSGTLLNKVILKFPSSKIEQTKIASFLTAVDEKITQLIQKNDLLTQYKKSVLQQIFSQELRFKDDDGRDFPDWDFIELEKVSSKVNKKNKDLSINYVLTNSATQGIVSQSHYFDRDIANQNNLGGYYVVETEDFVYNPRVSAHALVGPIKRNHLTVGVMSPLYTVFRFTIGNLDFFEQFFQTNYWHDYMKSVSNSGARHDRMNITIENFFGLPVPWPVKQEQTKIADFLAAMDEKISQNQTQLEAIKQYKQGLLQQMFV